MERCDDPLTTGSASESRLPGSIGVVGRKVGVSRPGEVDFVGECPFLRSGWDADTRSSMSVESWRWFAGLESREALFGCSDSDVFELAPLFSEEVLPIEKSEEMRLEGLLVEVAIVVGGGQAKLIAKRCEVCSFDCDTAPFREP